MRFQELVENQVLFSSAHRRPRLRTTKGGRSQAHLAWGVTLSRVPLGIRGPKDPGPSPPDAGDSETASKAETGSPLAAYAWFRAEPLPGFGGATADVLLREGRAEHVHAYLDRVAAGG